MRPKATCARGKLSGEVEEHVLTKGRKLGELACAEVAFHSQQDHKLKVHATRQPPTNARANA